MPARCRSPGEAGEVVHRAEVGPHGPVVHDRVAAVVGARSRGEQRHQVQVRDAEVGQVVDAASDALQVAGEQVRVGDVADRVGRLEPVRPEHPFAVALAQRVGARGMDGGDDVDDGRQDGGRVVDGVEAVPQVGRPAVVAGEDVDPAGIVGQVPGEPRPSLGHGRSRPLTSHLSSLRPM